MRDPLQSSRCSRLLKARANPERLRIVGCLRTGPRDVSELARSLGVKIANASHHLQVLKRLHLVVRERQGRRGVYALNPAMAPPGGDSIDLECCELRLTGGRKRPRRGR